jgi:hypothetical protein
MLAVLMINVGALDMVPRGTMLIVTLHPQYIIIRVVIFFSSITNRTAWAIKAITRFITGVTARTTSL